MGFAAALTPMRTIRGLLVCWAICSPAFAQSTLNMSRDLVPLGIASTNLVPDSPDLDAGPLFFKAVTYARNHPISRVIADPGAYYFRSLQYSGTHVGWDGLKDLTIDFQGADLYFSFPLANGITISNSQNLVLENFTADYDPLPFTQVRVVSVDGVQRLIRFALDGASQNPTLLNAVFAAPTSSFQSIEVHMFRNGRPLAGVPLMHAVNPVAADHFTIAADPTGYANSAVISRIRPGDIAFLGMRLGSGPVSVLHCTGCTFRNMTAYSSTYWGFNIADAQSSVLERLYSLPRPGTDRLASNYVGLALWSRGAGNQLRFNRLIRTMDAGLESTLGMIGTVRNQIDNRTLLLEGTPTSQLSAGSLPPNGATAAFQRASDGAILGSAVIVSQTAPPFAGQQAYQVTFSFDRDLPTGLVGAAMFGTDDSLSGGNTIIERNTLQDATDCCVGFGLYGLTNSVVRGNYIQRSAMAGMKVENALTPGGFNAPPAANLALNNNVIDGSNWIRDTYPSGQLGSILVYATANPKLVTGSPHQNITVAGNFVVDSGSAAVWLGNTSGGAVSGNTLLNSNNNSALESAVSSFGPTQQPIVVQSSVNITTANNIVDQTWRRMWVTDGQYRELAAYAPGSVARLNAYELGTFFPSPGITLTDADGVVTPVVIQSSTAHALDVQIPPSAALGGAYLTLTAGSLKYFGTLFLDSQDNIPALNGCTYELSPAASTTGANANNLPILVVTQPACFYGVSVTDSFLSSGGAGTGTGVVSVGFSANTSAARTTTVEIAGLTLTLTQAAAGSVSPVIQAIVDPWNYTSGLAPGEWVTISGTALAAGPSHTWNLNGTQSMPTILGQVTVSFNGTPAALLYVSPTQINALVPAAVKPGSVQVIVQSNGVSSSPFTVTATATQPAIYALPNSDGSAFFVTAALAGTATLVGNRAVDPRVLRAAQPGDLLDLYMVGLGGTTDPSKFLTGQLFAGAYPVSATVTATIGGESASVSFAGLTSPGLYLVRVTIPQDLSPGEQVIQVSAGSLRTGSTLKLLLAPAP